MTLGVIVAQQEECTLNCPDDAPCRIGRADFSDRVVELGETHINGMHCDCPVGKCKRRRIDCVLGAPIPLFARLVLATKCDWSSYSVILLSSVSHYFYLLSAVQ